MPIEAPDFAPATGTGQIGSTLRLVDPATEKELYSAGPFTETILTKLDLSYPDVRETISSFPGGHGTVDTTRFFGARGITAEFVFPQGANTETQIDRLMAMLPPGRRLWLYCKRPNWLRERRVLVRAKNFTCPPGTVRIAQVQWQAPHGLLEDSRLSEIILVPTASVGGGIIFPLSFPMTFDTALAPGAAVIPVGGTIETSPVIDIYGPCSDPQIRVFDTGDRLSFIGLDIAAGDYVRVDMRSRAAFLNGDTDQSRYSRLDFAKSTWWSLPVGDAVQVGFSASNVSGACQAVLAFRSAYV